MSATVAFTVRTVLDLSRALNSLDAVKVGKDEIVALEFTGATRAKIMANVVAMDPIKLAHEATDRALAKQHGVFAGMGDSPENFAKADAYRRAVEEALDFLREISIERIHLSALLNRPGDGKTIKLNPVPQSLLNRLAPILEFDASNE
jgi:hypothetical protein